MFPRCQVGGSSRLLALLLVMLVAAQLVQSADLLSSKGRQMIRRYEVLMLRARKDPLTGNYVIGIGHKQNVKQGQHITYREAQVLLRKDLTEAVQAVRRHAKVQLSQQQFDVLVSYTFSTNETTLARSTLLQLVNAGRLHDVPAELKKLIYVWSGTQNVLSPALSRRRDGEASFWVNGRIQVPKLKRRKGRPGAKPTRFKSAPRSPHYPQPMGYQSSQISQPGWQPRRQYYHPPPTASPYRRPIGHPLHIPTARPIYIPTARPIYPQPWGPYPTQPSVQTTYHQPWGAYPAAQPWYQQRNARYEGAPQRETRKGLLWSKQPKSGLWVPRPTAQPGWGSAPTVQPWFPQPTPRPWAPRPTARPWPHQTTARLWAPTARPWIPGATPPPGFHIQPVYPRSLGENGAFKPMQYSPRNEGSSVGVREAGFGGPINYHPHAEASVDIRSAIRRELPALRPYLGVRSRSPTPTSSSWRNSVTPTVTPVVGRNGQNRAGLRTMRPKISLPRETVPVRKNGGHTRGQSQRKRTNKRGKKLCRCHNCRCDIRRCRPGMVGCRFPVRRLRPRYPTPLPQPPLPTVFPDNPTNSTAVPPTTTPYRPPRIFVPQSGQPTKRPRWFRRRTARRPLLRRLGNAETTRQPPYGQWFRRTTVSWRRFTRPTGPPGLVGPPHPTQQPTVEPIYRRPRPTWSPSTFYRRRISRKFPQRSRESWFNRRLSRRLPGRVLPSSPPYQKNRYASTPSTQPWRRTRPVWPMPRKDWRSQHPKGKSPTSKYPAKTPSKVGRPPMAKATSSRYRTYSRRDPMPVFTEDADDAARPVFPLPKVPYKHPGRDTAWLEEEQDQVEADK